MKPPSASDFPPCPSGKTAWPWAGDLAEAQKRFDPAVAWPRITIVTPSYNQGDYIEETIRSILLQGYPNLEYFVMDGGSKDHTVEILKKYEPWLSGWVSEPDKGQTHAINKGWTRATGEILAYLNSDDWYYPDALRTIASIFLERPNVHWVAGEVKNGWGPEDIQSVHIPRPTSLAECLGRKNYGFHQPGMFWRRQLIDDIGLLSEEKHYSFCHDFWIRSMLKGYELHCLRQPIAFFRLHPQSQSVSTKHIFIHGDWMVFERYKDKLKPRERRQAKRWLREYEADALPSIVYRFLARGAKSTAMNYLLKRLHLIPLLQPKRGIPGFLFRTFISGKPPAWMRIQ